MLTFLAASVAAGLAPTVEVLVAARVVQAAGAAALVPTSLGLLLPEFPLERRGAAAPPWGGPAGGAPPPGRRPGGRWLGGRGGAAAFLLNSPSARWGGVPPRG